MPVCACDAKYISPAAAQYAYAPAPGAYPVQHHDPSAYTGTYAATHQAVPQAGSTYESYTFGYDPTQVCPQCLHASFRSESSSCITAITAFLQPSARRRIVVFAESTIIFRRR